MTLGVDSCDSILLQELKSLFSHCLFNVVFRFTLVVEDCDAFLKLSDELVAESLLFLNDCVSLRHTWLPLFLFEE